MSYLAVSRYKVISLSDLGNYVDPTTVPDDPNGVIMDRQQRIAAGKSLDDTRIPAGDEDLDQ